MNTIHPLHHLTPKPVNDIKAAFLKPFSWLKLGWQDLNYHPTASFGYGLIVASLMLVTFLFTSTHIYVIAAAICGFMFFGPLLAAVLCELSWRHEKHEHLDFDHSLSRLRQVQNTLYRFAAALLGFSIVWFALSAFILILASGSVAPAIELTVWDDFFALATTQQLALYIILGSVLMILAFSVSVVAIPAIIEMDISVQEAMQLSFDVFIKNIPTMAVWGVLIVLLFLLGISTLMIGMIVLFPLLGHATWYAYRDLVKDEMY